MKRFIFLTLSLVLLLTIIPGCVTVQTPMPNPIPPAETPSVIGFFSSNPTAINPGGTTTLSWNVTGANSVSIDHGVGQVAAAGTTVVSPAASTVYTISATNTSGTVTRSATTTVYSAPPQPLPTTDSNPVVNFTASYLGGNADNSTRWQLNWNVSNATQIVIQPEIGAVNPTGSTVVTVAAGQMKTYRLEALNGWGWAYWQVSLASP